MVSIESLKKEVQAYFDLNPHPGFSRPFQVGRIERNKLVEQTKQLRNAFVVVPAGLEEEDISNPDPSWNLGLSEIGHRFGVELRLPYWLYEK